MNNTSQMEGQRFGRLTVVSRATSVNRRAAWVCACDCGATTTTLGKYLRSGETTSCGCRKRTVLGENCRKHGKFGTAEYWAWHAMLQRCGNPNNKSFKNYGARGIKVAPRWKKFGNFLDDMGNRPSPKHSIERRNNNRGYSAGNCYWATTSQQAANKRNTLTVGGVPLVEWARKNKIPYSTAYSRYRKHLLE